MKRSSFPLMFDGIGFESEDFLQFPNVQNNFDYEMNMSPESIPEFNPMSFEDIPISITAFEEGEMLSGWNSLKQVKPTKISRKKPKKVENLKETKPVILRPFESCQATETCVIYLRMLSNQMFAKTGNSDVSFC